MTVGNVSAMQMARTGAAFTARNHATRPTSAARKRRVDHIDPAKDASRLLGHTT